MTADSQPLRSEQTMIPELELEWFEPPAEPELGRLPVGSVQFGWVGVGPLGSRLAEWFYHLGYEKVIAVGSDEEHLERLHLPERQKCLWPGGLSKRIRFGKETSSRRTVGHDLFGRMEEIFGEQLDFPMLCLSEEEPEGAALFPSVMDLLSSYARLLNSRLRQRTSGLFLLHAGGRTGPLRAEVPADILPKVAACAGGLGQKRKHTDSASIRRTAELFALFNQLSAKPTPYLSFDSMDYLDVLTAGGWIGMGQSRLQGQPDRCRVSQAVREALDQSTQGGRYNLKQTQAAACLMVGQTEMMAHVPGLPEILHYGFDVFTALLGRARVHRGMYEDDGDCLRIYVLLSGLQPNGS